MNSIKVFIVGTLALAGTVVATADAQALPIQPISSAMVDGAAGAQVEPVYFYGYRRPFFRYGYGFGRPFFGYRRFGYGYGFRPYYGYRRPFYGYGYRRF